MAGTDVHADLVVSSFGLTIGLGTAAIILVGVVYLLIRPVAEAGFGPSRHPTRPRPRQLALEADERWLAAAAYRRAAGVAVALLTLVVVAPWLHGPIEHLADRWRAAADAGGDRVYGLFAAVVWLGLLPVAVFLRSLPRRAWARRSLRSADWAMRLGTSSSPGLPNSIDQTDLRDLPPYHAALRRACRLYGINAALGAGAGRRGVAGGPTSTAALVIVPAVGGLALAGFVHLWIALVALVAVALWSVAVGMGARRDALRAPGTAALDYLMLVSAARDGRSRETRVRADAYLTQNPATLQDHAGLVAVFAGARWIDEPRWDPLPATQSDVVAPAAMTMIDRNGRDAQVHVAIRLVYGDDRRWHVARVWIEQVALGDGVRARESTPVRVAWA